MSEHAWCCRYMNGNDEALEDISSGRLADMHKELADCIRIVGFTDQVIGSVPCILFYLLFLYILFSPMKRNM